MRSVFPVIGLITTAATVFVFLSVPILLHWYDVVTTFWLN